MSDLKNWWQNYHRSFLHLHHLRLKFHNHPHLELMVISGDLGDGYPVRKKV